MTINNSNRIDWRLTFEKPIAGSRVIAETLDGEYIEEQISDEVFDIWDESIIRWAYSPSWFNKYFSKQMNPPKEDKKEEKNDKKLQEDIMDAMLYGPLLWFLLSGDSDSNAKCRECCCDGLNDSQDDKMDELRSRLSKSDKDKDKRTGNGEDSSESDAISDEQTYIAMRNQLYYMHAGSTGYDGTIYRRREAVEDVINICPHLEWVAKKADPWFFVD